MKKKLNSRCVTLEKRLGEVFEQHIFSRANGLGNVRRETSKTRREAIGRMFSILKNELHYGIVEPTNLKPKHVEAIIAYCVEEKYAATTIYNWICYLRMFCEWIGKPGMVKTLGDYAPNLAAQRTEKRSGAGAKATVDFWEMWDRIRDVDEYVAMQVLLMATFSASIREVLRFKPFIADKGTGTHMDLWDGRRGGKPRTVLIDTCFKRGVVAASKSFITKKTLNPRAVLANPNKKIEQNQARYFYILRKCGMSKDRLGVTGRDIVINHANTDELEKRGLLLSGRT